MTVSFKHIRMPFMTAVVMSALVGGFAPAPAYAAPSQAQQWDSEGAMLGGSSSVPPPPPAVPAPAPQVVVPPAATAEKSGGWFGWFSSDDDEAPVSGRITTDVLGVDVVTPAVTAQEPAAEAPPAPVLIADDTEEPPPEPLAEAVPEQPPEPVVLAPAPVVPAAVAQEQQALRDVEAARQAAAEQPLPHHADTRAEQSVADAAADKGEPPRAVVAAEVPPPPAQQDDIVWSKAGVPAQPEPAPLPKPVAPPDLAVLQQESLSAIAQDDTALAGAVTPPPPASPAQALAPMPMRDAIRTALAVNPDVRRTAAARDMLEAALRDTEGQTRPQVSLFGSLSGSYDTSKEKSDRFDDAAFAKAGVRANWQLYNFGASAARIRAGEESVVRGDLDLVDRRETTAFEVLAIYIEALRQREMLDIETFRIAQHEEFLKMTEEAAKAEQVLGSQLLLARTGLDQKKQAHMNVERGLQEMFFALDRMTDVRLELSQLSVPFTPLVVLPEEDEFIARSIDDAPEVKALQAAVAAQRNELTGARKDRLGQISLNASAAGDRNLIESGEGTQASGDVALEYSVPLYTGGSMQARIDRASGALVQAEADLQKTRMMLREQLRLAYFSIQQNEDILRAARNEEEAAMATLDAYRGEVAYGGRAFSDVIMQIDNVSSARARAVSARYAKMLAAYAVVRRQNGLLHYFNLRP